METYPLFSKGKVIFMDIKNLNLNEIWQDSFGWSGVKADPRKLDDKLEEDFWRKVASSYTREYDINKDTSLFAEALAKRIKPGSVVLEIGPGSGNFTLLMAQYARKVIGVDFSCAMLEQLAIRTEAARIKNIEMINAKWELYTPATKVDYIVSVNSLYRIKDMRTALMKMYEYANKGIVILRSIQRPYFYELYKELGLSCENCLDYQLLPMYFWQQDIAANVEFLTYNRKKSYADLTAVMEEMKKDLGVEAFSANQSRILKALEKYVEGKGEGLVYSVPRTAVVISLEK